MEPFFIAHICLFGGNFAPRGWAFCQGQLLPIAQYTALFSLVGTMYGGDGRTTFGLPDFRGRIPVGQGYGPGLYPMTQGEMGGVFNTTLLTVQIPSHTHTASASVPVKSTAGNSANPGNAVISGGTTSTYAPAANATGNLAGITATVQPAGSSQPFSNTMPSLGINFIIALEGIYPSRN
jgi:microcystin-dependent protein